MGHRLARDLVSLTLVLDPEPRQTTHFANRKTYALTKEKSMGYAEMIRLRVQTLPQEKQTEVFDFVEFIATRCPAAQGQTEDQRKQRVLAALAAARKVWPQMDAQQIEEISTNLRSQWDGRAWDRPC
jgi:hypothetical protein